MAKTKCTRAWIPALLRRKVVLALFALLLCMSVLAPAALPANAASTRVDTMTSAVNFRSDLEPKSAACYDSDRQMPVYTVTFDIPNGSANAPSHGNAGNCEGIIQIEDQAWRAATPESRRYTELHERDHLDGWTHDEGVEPNHNCTRGPNENAAHSGRIPLGFSQPCVY